MALISLVFGKVQGWYAFNDKISGVFFRKYTEKKGNELGLVGWVQNTPKGTVIGDAQGPVDSLEKMYGFY